MQAQALSLFSAVFRKRSPRFRNGASPLSEVPHLANGTRDGAWRISSCSFIILAGKARNGIAIGPLFPTGRARHVPVRARSSSPCTLRENRQEASTRIRTFQALTPTPQRFLSPNSYVLWGSRIQIHVPIAGYSGAIFHLERWRNVLQGCFFFLSFPVGKDAGGHLGLPISWRFQSRGIPRRSGSRCVLGV